MTNIPNIPYYEEYRRNLPHPTHITKEGVNELLGIQVNSLEELVQQLVNRNAYYLHQHNHEYFLTYASDICFNYRDKYIFIPFTVYDTDQYVKVSSQTFVKSMMYKTVETYINSNGVPKIRHYLHPKYNITMYNQMLQQEPHIHIVLQNRVYTIDTSLYPFTIRTDFSFHKLYKDYQDLHKKYQEDYKRYILVDSHIAKTERTLRTRIYLPKYGDYNVIHYQDIRYYPHNEVNEETVSTIPFKERLLTFEMELYMLSYMIQQGVEITTDNTEYYQAYKEKRFVKLGTTTPLILKWYYIDPTKFRKKSYEKFYTTCQS